MPQRRFLSVVLALAGLAAAQQAASPLKLVLSQFLVQTVTKDGKAQEELAEAPKQAHPGDLFEQQLQVGNVGKAPLRNVRPTLPIKPGTVYFSQGGAPEGTLTEFSLDGGKTFGAAPLKRTVTVTENGKSVTKEVVVPPSEYTNVRWTLASLNPAQTVKFSVRVRVR